MIHSASLSLTASSHLVLNMPTALCRPAVRPVALHITVVCNESPLSIPHHLTIPRNYLFDVSLFNVIPLQMIKILCGASASMAERFACIDILIYILGAVKGMAPVMTQQTSFDLLLQHSLVRSDFPGVTRVYDLLFKLVEVYPQASRPILEACLPLLNSLDGCPVAPLRSREFFEILVLVAPADPRLLMVVIGVETCMPP